MNIHPITVRTFEITDAPGLDSIRVYLQDLAPGQGRITLECYGCAWACYFGSMGEGKGIGDFVRTAGSDYITNALAVARGARGVARQKAYLRCIVDAVQAALNVQADECASRDSNPPTPPPSTRTSSRAGSDGWVLEFYPGSAVDQGPREPSLKRRRGGSGGGIG